MLKRLIWLVMACVLISVPVFAQTYVRPSKGANIAAFSSLFLASTTNSSTAIYDWSAFQGMLIRVALRNSSGHIGNLQNATNCTRLPIISVEGDTSTAFTTSSPPVGTHGNLNLSVDASHDWQQRILSVGNIPQYVRLTITTGVAPVGGASQCYADIDLTPIPFAEVGKVEGLYHTGDSPNEVFPVIVGGRNLNGGVFVDEVRVHRSSTAMLVRDGAVSAPIDNGLISVTTTARLMAASNNNRTKVLLQNQSTVIVYCHHDNTVTTTAFTFTLKAATATSDGSGGSLLLEGYYGNVYFTTASGTNSVGVFSW